MTATDTELSAGTVSRSSIGHSLTPLRQFTVAWIVVIAFVALAAGALVYRDFLIPSPVPTFVGCYELTPTSNVSAFTAALGTGEERFALESTLRSEHSVDATRRPRSGRRLGAAAILLEPRLSWTPIAQKRILVSYRDGKRELYLVANGANISGHLRIYLSGSVEPQRVPVSGARVVCAESAS